MSTTPVRVAASAWTGVTERISRLRARLITPESTATQLSRNLMIGLVVRASSSISSSRQLLAVEGELPLEAEQRLRSEEAVLQGLLARAGGTAATELDALGDLAVEVLRPHHRMAGIGQGGRPAVEQRQDLVGVERDLVGDAQVEQPVEDRPRVRGGAQRDRGVGAGPVAEAVARARPALGPEGRRVGEVGGVVDGVHLQDQPQRAGDQLLLVGLDAEARSSPGGAGRRAHGTGAGRCAAGGGR